jgi:phenylpropionate dioxygenase-like ring-hydroxylating dioxygenase large terminal subunit
MYINFWYPALQSEELTDQPVKRRMLGQDFVLFRDTDGAARCLSNTCTHRGGSLAGGKMKGDCVECPYHGWQFDGEGLCHRIPSLGPNAKIPGRARVDAYPTQERYGLVFAFLGDLPEEERPPLLHITEYGPDGPSEGWAATIQHFEWGFDYKRSMENGIDPAHNEFVHPTHGFSGEREDYKVDPPKLIQTEWGNGFWNEVYAPPLADKKMQETSGRTESATIHAGTGHIGVNTIWTYIHPTPERTLPQDLFECPIDTSNTSLFLVNLRNFLIHSEGGERMMKRNAYVAFQDRDVLLDVNPVITPETRTKELFLPADSPIAAYRDKLKEWEARGWRIDTDEVERNQKKVAYAIPCPARRKTKGWVLDPVPLVPASSETAGTGTAQLNAMRS